MPDHIELVDLTEHHLNDVLEICRRELGPDYHSEDDFRQCLTHRGVYRCMVAQDENMDACGFSLSMLLDPVSADSYLKLPDSPQRDHLLSCRKIGILDSAAVDKEKRKKGLGKELVLASFNALVNDKADVVCAMVWKDIHGVANAERIVVELGLHKEMEIQGYWNTMTDDPEGHSCPACGEPPCKCSGILYLRHSAE